jgi:hypothetical protein
VVEGEAIMQKHNKRRRCGMVGKRNGNGCQVRDYLMTDDFKVEVGKDGWERVAGYLFNVSFSDFSGGNGLQLTFWENKDLDVLTFFTDWIVKKEAYDVVVWMGSGKRGLLFSGCSVSGLYMDDLNVCDGEKIDFREEVKVSVELSYVGVFVMDKEKAEKCAIG